MKKFISRIIKNIKYYFDPMEGFFQKSYEAEKKFWKDGWLTEDVYRSQFNIRTVFGPLFELGNPFTVKQIREDELWVKPGTTISTTMNIWIKTLEDFHSFSNILETRIGEMGRLSIHVNGHLFIFIKFEGSLRILHSNRVNFKEFLVEKSFLMNKKFFRGESA